jgi:uncharacterized membrane protein
VCCYALPLVPALLALAWVRDDRFVRRHAVRALLFYSAVFLAQLGLLLWLVLLGNAVADGRPAIVLGLLFYLAMASTGILALIFWLRAIADGLAGHAVKPVGLGRPALHLERWLWRHGAGSPSRTENDTT